MSNSPIAPDPGLRDLLPFSRWWPVLAGAGAGILMRLAFSGGAGQAYGAMMASFICLAPVLVGVVTVYLAERQARRSWWYCFWAPFAANVLCVAGTLALMIEGWICALLILPVFGLLGGVAGLIMGWVCRRSRWPRQAVYTALLLPLVLGHLEAQWPLPADVSQVERSIHSKASPAQLWPHLLDTPAIAAHEIDRAWLYRIGVPTPESGLSQESDGRLLRQVRMGKNIRFDQVAEDWEPQHRVRWSYRFDKDSFPAHALDDHVQIGGHYFDLLETEYRLTPDGSGSRLSITMRYRVSTQFNWYALPIARWLITDFSETILSFYARRAELALTQRSDVSAVTPSSAAPSASATSMPSTPADMMPPA